MLALFVLGNGKCQRKNREQRKGEEGRREERREKGGEESCEF